MLIFNSSYTSQILAESSKFGEDFWIRLLWNKTVLAVKHLVNTTECDYYGIVSHFRYLLYIITQYVYSSLEFVFHLHWHIIQVSITSTTSPVITWAHYVAIPRKHSNSIFKILSLYIHYYIHSLMFIYAWSYSLACKLTKSNSILAF